MKPESIPFILFVCTGNQIRSPLAAAIFQTRLKKSELQDAYRVESAGTWARPGQSDPRAMETAHRMVLEIEEHRSRLINEQVLSDASLVIVMESGQKEALEVEYPQVLGRVHLLSELAGESAFDVSDPAGEETEFYIQTGEELLALVNSAFDRILHMVQKI